MQKQLARSPRSSAGIDLRGWQRLVSGVGQGGSRDDSRHRHCRSCRGEALARCCQGQLVPAPDVPKDVQDGASNEWLEAVTDETYDKLK